LPHISLPSPRCSGTSRFATAVFTKLMNERREISQRQQEAELEVGDEIVREWLIPYSGLDEHTLPRAVALDAMLVRIEEGAEEEESPAGILPMHHPVPHPIAASSASAAAALPGEEGPPAPQALPRSAGLPSSGALLAATGLSPKAAAPVPSGGARPKREASTPTAAPAFVASPSGEPATGGEGSLPTSFAGAYATPLPARPPSPSSPDEDGRPTPVPPRRDCLTASRGGRHVACCRLWRGAQPH